jgi:hypothetical protein
MGFKCSECGKELSNEKGLAGHLYGVHGRRIGLKADVATAKKKAEQAFKLSQDQAEILSNFMKEVETRLRELEGLLKGYKQFDGANLPERYELIAKQKLPHLEIHRTFK